MENLERYKKKFPLLNESECYEFFLDLYDLPDPMEDPFFLKIVDGNDPRFKLIFLRYLEEIPEKRAVDMILRIMKDSNRVVYKASVTSFARNHYNKKNTPLRVLAQSANVRMANFAIYSLAKIGDRAIIPTLHERLRNSKKRVQKIILRALRYLADNRTPLFLYPFLEMEDAELQLEALTTLAELSKQGISIPASIFLKYHNSPSSSLRRVSLFALQNYPSKTISRLFIQSALKDADDTTRVRALQALTSFPLIDWIPDLVNLIVSDATPFVRLQAESTLKRFPHRLLKKGLLSLLSQSRPEARPKTLLLLAEVFGGDPAVKNIILKNWNQTTSVKDKLGIIDIFREIEGRDVEDTVFKNLTISPLLTYGFVDILHRFWNDRTNKHLLDLLTDSSVPSYVIHAILNLFIKRQPHVSIKEDLLAYLKKNIQDNNVNNRYLTIQILQWYPSHQVLPELIGHLPNEYEANIKNRIAALILEKTKKNPNVLISAYQSLPWSAVLAQNLSMLLQKGIWPSSHLPLLIVKLKSMWERNLVDHPVLSPCLAQWVHSGQLTLKSIWPELTTSETQISFLQSLKNLLVNIHPALPEEVMNFILNKIQVFPPSIEIYFMEILALTRSPLSVIPLTKTILSETDPRILNQAKQALQNSIWKEAA